MIDIPDSILPSDAEGRNVCPVCEKTVDQCACPEYDPSQPKTDHYSPRVSLDRSGRKGKVVTLVSGLPADVFYLKKLAKTLKQETGSGGTHALRGEEGRIEIQGDKQNLVREKLKAMGFDV